jgi:hypothetical protein
MRWITTSASSTGSMLVLADDLHPMASSMASRINCDDPVHGSGPGEIIFHHMSVVQRGVRSPATTAGNRLGLTKLLAPRNQMGAASFAKALCVSNAER